MKNKRILSLLCIGVLGSALLTTGCVKTQSVSDMQKQNVTQEETQEEVEVKDKLTQQIENTFVSSSNKDEIKFRYDYNDIRYMYYSTEDTNRSEHIEELGKIMETVHKGEESKWVAQRYSEGERYINTSTQQVYEVSINKEYDKDTDMTNQEITSISLKEFNSKEEVDSYINKSEKYEEEQQDRFEKEKSTESVEKDTIQDTEE